MTAVNAQMVRADCLRVGDVHAAYGKVDEIRRDVRVTFVGWDGGRFGYEASGSMFNIIERGPFVLPGWFTVAAEEVAEFQSHEQITEWIRIASHNGDYHQDVAVHLRALEIQAERRRP